MSNEGRTLHRLSPSPPAAVRAEALGIDRRACGYVGGRRFGQPRGLPGFQVFSRGLSALLVGDDFVGHLLSLVHASQPARSTAEM